MHCGKFDRDHNSCGVHLSLSVFIAYLSAILHISDNLEYIENDCGIDFIDLFPSTINYLEYFESECGIVFIIIIFIPIRLSIIDLMVQL